MKKRNKLWIGLIILLIVLLVVDIAGANYLVSFAIGRTTSGGASVVPKASTTSETKTLVGENSKRISAVTKAWLEETPSSVVELTSNDGLRLEGEIWNLDESSHQWVILVHGYTANRKMMRDYEYFFAQKGYNLLAPDLRGHGGSEGNYIGMGWPDRKDMLLWINLICDLDPNAEIVLFGVSMGGGTVLMTSGEDLPQNVKAIVEDCGYTSVWDIFSDELKVLFHLPEFPLLYTASMIGKIRAGYTFTEASAMEQVKKATVPILFIHGSEDNFVHTEMVYRLFEVCPTQKDIMVVENAGHGQSYYYAPEEYEAKVFSFLESCT